jgi:hypothetical protein
VREQKAKEVKNALDAVKRVSGVQAVYKEDPQAARRSVDAEAEIEAIAAGQTQQRTTSPVIRSSSPAPTQFRTGSPESIAGKSKAEVDRRAKESTQPKPRDTKVSKKEQREANRIAAEQKGKGTGTAPVAPYITQKEQDQADLLAKIKGMKSVPSEDSTDLAEANKLAKLIRDKSPEQKRREAEEAAAVAREIEKSLARYSDKDGGAFFDDEFFFSRGTPVKGLTTTELKSEIDRFVGDNATYRGTVTVFDSVADFIKLNPEYAGRIPSNAKGFVDPSKGRIKLSKGEYGSTATRESKGRAVLFANNIAKGEGIGVLLHEVGVHIGFRNFFNASQFKTLANTVRSWAKAPANTLEGRIGRAAQRRLEAANTPESQLDDEILAYAVEEAIKAGVEPAGTKGGSPVANWLRAVLNAFNKAVEALGLAPEKLKVGDLVNMAYGAAQLEIRGTWHGSDATFKAFDKKFASAGEGAFDRRFSGSESLGTGTYVTPDKEYAEYYQKAVPFGKAANASMM